MKEKYSDLGEGLFAVIETKKGDIVLSLEFEKTPMTVANFVGLAEGTLKNSAKNGKPYYDGLKFHRVIPDFVIQGGCPLGTGTGGPGYQFPDEFDDSLKHDKEGVLSMANAGPQTNGSQFFITLAPTPHLDGKHSVFGYVVKGLDVIQKIKQDDEMIKVTIIRSGKKAGKFIVNDKIFKELVDKSEKREKEALNKKLEKQFKRIKKEYPDAKQTDSGMFYIVHREGDKKGSPKMGQTVTTHYKGTLLSNGQKFDSSYDRGEPINFQVGQVIQGWNEALMTMSKGEHRTLIIPPHLAYGERGAAGVIPPNAWLVFEVELLDFQ